MLAATPGVFVHPHGVGSATVGVNGVVVPRWNMSVPCGEIPKMRNHTFFVMLCAMCETASDLCVAASNMTVNFMKYGVDIIGDCNRTAAAEGKTDFDPTTLLTCVAIGFAGVGVACLVYSSPTIQTKIASACGAVKSAASSVCSFVGHMGRKKQGGVDAGTQASLMQDAATQYSGRLSGDLV